MVPSGQDDLASASGAAGAAAAAAESSPGDVVGVESFGAAAAAEASAALRRGEKVERGRVMKGCRTSPVALLRHWRHIMTASDSLSYRNVSGRKGGVRWVR